MPDIHEVPLLRPPDHEVVAELELLLTQAKAGEVVAFVHATQYSGRHVHGGHRFGVVGSYELRDFALMLRLLDLELDSMIRDTTGDPFDPGTTETSG